ncbi:MAG: hypothetical protein JWP97_498 [Labilithrix sp.]|nr:hypothetical protein [Labilithrix sp.]
MSARLLLAVAFATVASLGVACGSSEDPSDGAKPGEGPDAPLDPGSQPPGSDDPTVGSQLAEKPWEVVSNKGETFLTNVFYADASQNEQIMPWTIDGHTMIDRLVYPTLGNPNLYTKADAKDEFVAVMRVEDAAYEFLNVKPVPVQGSTLSRLPVTNTPESGFVFFLVPRPAREGNTESTLPINSGSGTNVYRIYPNEILVNPVPADMPESLKARKTLRFLFRQGAMQRVPAGLYDLRMEIRKDNDFYKPAGNTTGIYEYQYNAVRVFETEPEEYPVINVTDTQVSVGDVYGTKTKDKLSELVQFLNTTTDATIQKAAFITFNGDLHNGGSPASLRQRSVAWTYNSEAKAIVETLKYLPVPIFLTAGNHDGYVATGHVPSAVKALDTGLLESLKEVVSEANPKAWPGFDQSKYQAYLDQTEASDQLGGRPMDIFTGSFMRSAAGAGFGDGWKEVKREDRNFILYDGFYQWQKTYGPLSTSWKFGKNFYISLNSFELRQHRRTGWGMYTVNYGGGMSEVQMQWLDRELLRSKVTGDDVVLLAHHDPRGGHKSEDPGYYFDQLDYSGIFQSAINYLVAEVFNPQICKLPQWALPRDKQDNCVHDGLQEWMRPDTTFDCAWSEQKDGKCNAAQFDTTKGGTKSFWTSGVELMKRLATNTQVRTVLLGHTHYNQLEVLQNGDELLPGQFPIDDARAQLLATLEVQNPIRAAAFAHKQAGLTIENQPFETSFLPMNAVTRRNDIFAAQIAPVLLGTQRVLDAPVTGKPRELVVLRLVSAADLTDQTVKASGITALGFAVLDITKHTDVRAYANPQVNKATFFVNRGSNVFTNVKTIDLDRNARLKPHDTANPIQQLYNW